MKIPGFRLGIYVFKDAEIVDFAAPHGVFSVARRFDPELEAFLVADAMRPVQAQAGFTVLPNYCFADRPAMDAFLIPGGFGTRQEMHNGRLHEFIRSLPEETLLTSVCTGSWIYGAMGLLDGLPATNRKEPDRRRVRAAAAWCRSTGSRRSRPPAASAAPASWTPAASSPRAASPRGWRWASTCCAAPATTRRSSPRWRGSWSTRRRTT